MLKVLKKIPWYGYVIGLALLGLQYGMYLLAQVIAPKIGITPISPKIDGVDNYISLRICICILGSRINSSFFNK